MHKNPIWLVFLSAVAVVTLWYLSIALYHVYEYSSLTATTKATIETWSVKEIKDDEFAPYAHYNFNVNETQYTSEDALKYPIFRNAWAAEQILPQLANNKWIVWYKPSNPKFSTLQKKYPTKESVSAGVLIALMTYFVWLGYYVSKKQQ